ncbi:MAG: OmpA family protein [Syntrophobacteraceae bacterium]
MCDREWSTATYEGRERMMYRRQRQRKKVSHADDWLMTYADMITLLLCFCVLFVSVSISQKKNRPKVDVVQKVELPAQKPKPVEAYVPVPALDEMIKSGWSDPVKEEKTEKSGPPEPGVEAAVGKTSEQVPPLASLPEFVDNLKSQGAANFEQKGDRITSLEISSAAFFGSGSAILSPAGKAILHDVAENLKAEKFKDYQVTVEGHTDDAPINTSLFPSNWELSTARAAAVVRFFLDEETPAQKLRAAGYADTFPKVPNRDANGRAIPENQAQNRRVVIKLEKIEKTT